jgi:hypothetical protein
MPFKRDSATSYYVKDPEERQDMQVSDIQMGCK